MLHMADMEAGRAGVSFTTILNRSFATEYTYDQNIQANSLVLLRITYPWLASALLALPLDSAIVHGLNGLEFYFDYEAMQ